MQLGALVAVANDRTCGERCCGWSMLAAGQETRLAPTLDALGCERAY